MPEQNKNAEGQLQFGSDIQYLEMYSQLCSPPRLRMVT
jgi:hypothetical protein